MNDTAQHKTNTLETNSNHNFYAVCNKSSDLDIFTLNCIKYFEDIKLFIVWEDKSLECILVPVRGRLEKCLLLCFKEKYMGEGGEHADHYLCKNLQEAWAKVVNFYDLEDASCS